MCLPKPGGGHTAMPEATGRDINRGPCWEVVAQAFNPSTREAEAGGYL